MLLSLLAPHTYKGAVAQVAWPTVLLICGIVTYVNLMQDIGTVDFLGNQVAAIGVPLLAALVICYIGAAVSAFASTTGILGALIPLAVPFLLAGRGRRDRSDHRAGDLLVGRRLEPVLHLRCARHGQRAGGPARLRLPPA